MKLCPPEPDLERFLAGLLPEGETAPIENHLETCPTCRSWITEARSDDALLDRLCEVELPDDVAAAPKRVGNYRIQGRIGAGGMGIVYEALQDNPRRRVALKVMRPGLLSARALRRFEHEAQALGRLQHPGIARILEAGAMGTGTAAQPFFAMELVRGNNLTAYVQEHAVSRRDRLRLFGRICDAVQHAHEKGVVHRDLKPGNILVDESGQPKVLDFGVSRLQDDDTAHTLRTRAGQLIGTLAYMSPEQVSGDPDAVGTRSDVHALGVVLYELLTGDLPYAVAAKPTPEVVRIIAEAEPTALSARDPSLRGDLSTIVHCCLAKDPGRRYASAAEVGEEVRRYLEHEPLLAQPPSALYQLAKFTRRHRALVGGVSAVFVTLAAGVVVSLAFWREADTAAADALRRQRRAEEEAAQAEAAREFMQEVLIHAAPGQRTGDEATLRDVLDTAVRRVDRLQEPLVEASVRHTLGRVYADLGELSKADDNLCRSLALYEQVHGERHVKTAYVITSLAELRIRQARFDDVRELVERVIARRDELEDGEGIVLGLALQSAGHAAYNLGKLEEAEAHYREAIVAMQRRDEDGALGVAVTQACLALALQKRGHLDEAETLYRESLAAQSELRGARNPANCTTMGNLASLLESQGRYGETESLRRDTLSIAEEAYGEEHERVGMSLRALGNVLHKQGRSEEGLTLMQRGVAVQERALGETHPRVAQSLHQIGGVLLALGRIDESLRIRRRAVTIANGAFGPEHVLTLNAEGGVGKCLLALGRYEEAERTLSACSELAAAEVPWARGMIASMRRERIEALIGLGREDELVPLLRQLASEAKGLSQGEWAEQRLRERDGDR